MYGRYIKNPVNEDLKSKMVFVGGPRQVGKTTLCTRLFPKFYYFNWDNQDHRSLIIEGPGRIGDEIGLNRLAKRLPVVVFDEIHKFTHWRGLIKGLYDTHKSDISFIITGSAMLDYYRKGGDSLQGRYHYYRLHPFSINELCKNPTKKDFADLIKFGGFPEPFLGGSEKNWRRWQRERLSRVVYDDIRDLENVKEISNIELLIEELPNRVGSPYQ